MRYSVRSEATKEGSMGVRKNTSRVKQKRTLVLFPEDYVAENLLMTPRLAEELLRRSRKPIRVLQFKK